METEGSIPPSWCAKLADANTEQAVQTIADLVVETQRDTIVGNQYINLIATYQQYISIDTPFFLSDQTKFPYKPKNSRITYIWMNLQKNQPTIQGESWWLSTSSIRNNRTIMSTIQKAKEKSKGTPSSMSNTNIGNSNVVRLYLNVTFVSKVSSPD